MSNEDQQQPPINGDGGPEPIKRPEIVAGQQIVLDPQTCQNLENCAHAAQASLLDLMSMMPRGAEHMPLFVVMKVIAELSFAYWGNAGAKLWDDAVGEAVHRMGQFTLLTPEGVARWKQEAEDRVKAAREERGEPPQIILPGNRSRL